MTRAAERQSSLKNFGKNFRKFLAPAAKTGEDRSVTVTAAEAAVDAARAARASDTPLDLIGMAERAMEITQ